MCEEAAWIELCFLAFVPNRFKVEGLCIKTLRRNSYAFDCVPDNLKTQKICNEAMRENPAAYFLVSDYFKTQEMRNDAADVNPWSLYDVPDYHKTQPRISNKHVLSGNVFNNLYRQRLCLQ